MVMQMHLLVTFDYMHSLFNAQIEHNKTVQFL